MKTKIFIMMTILLKGYELCINYKYMYTQRPLFLSTSLSTKSKQKPLGKDAFQIRSPSRFQVQHMKKGK